MKNKVMKRFVSILMVVMLMLTSFPFTAVAEEVTDTEIQTLSNEIYTKLLLHPSTTFTKDVKMGSKSVLSYYYKNLLYSSPNLSTSVSHPPVTIDVSISCPNVVVGLYDGDNMPTFPVSAYLYLTSEHRITGLVLSDESELYETSSPTDYQACTNVWRGINANTPWVTPEDQETIFFFTSKKEDLDVDIFYTRGNYNGYQISCSNTLTPKTDYLIEKLAQTSNGYIKSDYNDTSFQLILTTAYNNHERINLETRCPLGHGAAQYIVDSSSINAILKDAKVEFPKIKEFATEYDKETLLNYYNALLAVVSLNINKEIDGINDDNVESLVKALGNKIQTITKEYNEARKALGQIYKDPAVVKENVNTNYSSATINSSSNKARLGNTVVSDVTFQGRNYNFGKNLAYCSSKSMVASTLNVNNVSSWVVTPATVVMIYDGTSETSFPIKLGFGTTEWSSYYSGSRLNSIHIGNEVQQQMGTSSIYYQAGNPNWLCCNHQTSIKPANWFNSISDINTACPNGNVTASGGGIDLTLQYGGFFNKIVLDNGKYSAHLGVVDLSKTGPISLFLRYANMDYDTYPHRASNNAKQYVLNIKPLVDKLDIVKKNHADFLAKGNIDDYEVKSLNRYYRAVDNIISFDIDSYFASCTDLNAESVVENCTNDIDEFIKEYDAAYKGLVKTYKITFKNYAGEIVSEQYCNEGETPVAPENTAPAKVSSTSKYHFYYTWPTLYAATSNLVYSEWRDSALCTLDDGTITRDATCTQAGEKVYHCSVCDGDMYESINKLEHDYSVYKPQYKNGTKLSNTLKHDLTCAVGGEILYSETCDFELVSDGDATTIYECTVCHGLVIYTKAKFNIAFVDENGDTISSKTYYEGQEVDIPNLPNAKVDEAGHHSYSWDIEPSTIPSIDITYTVIENVEKHIFTSYTYNNNATRDDVYGTETAICSIDGCTFADTRACTEQHTPTKFDINGKIVLSSDTKGTASEKAAANITVSIDGTGITATTDKDGCYTLEGLAEGEYAVTISGDSTIDRKATIVVNLDNADGDQIDVDAIGIIVFDYNKDGKINTIDAMMFTSDDINQENANLLKAVFNKKIVYDEITV